YDALKIGEPGSGGEYTDQDGFGWTNGFALELLEKYGQVIQWDQSIPVVVSNKVKKQTQLTNLSRLRCLTFL
ncbi:unnamed protein product, partial [Nesidiocoris tenuis]